MSTSNDVCVSFSPQTFSKSDPQRVCSPTEAPSRRRQALNEVAVATAAAGWQRMRQMRSCAHILKYCMCKSAMKTYKHNRKWHFNICLLKWPLCVKITNGLNIQNQPFCFKVWHSCTWSWPCVEALWWASAVRGCARWVGTVGRLRVRGCARVCPGARRGWGNALFLCRC